MSTRTHAPEYVSPADVADRLGVPERTVQYLCQRGLLPAVRLPGGRLWRIHAGRLDALLAGQTL